MANGDNALLYSGLSPFIGVTQSDPVPTTWAPSTWRPGMPPTAQSVDTSMYPMPTPDQINAQRALIQQHLRQYGYQPAQLSDWQVLSTMSNLPQRPVQNIPWVEDYLQRHPEERSGARPGIDLPTNQTYEVSNLAHPALNTSQPTSVGYALSGMPRGAILEHYGQATLDENDRNWFALTGGDPNNMATSTYGPSGQLTSQVNPPGASSQVAQASGPVPAGGAMPTYGAQPYPGAGAASSGAPNALQSPRSGAVAAPNWTQQMQQQNPSLWQALMRWMGLAHQQQQPADGSGGGLVGGGGGPRYTIGNVPAVPQARPLTYSQ